MMTVKNFEGQTKTTSTFILLLVMLVSACGTPAPAERQAGSGAATGRITATPNPVPSTEALGSTTISWDSGDGSWAQVYVSVNDQPDQLIVEGPRGGQTAPWIAQGSRYRFRLYRARAHTEVLAEVVVAQKAFVTATPNPVPAQRGLGKTMVTWSTGDGSEGQVYVSPPSAKEVLFGQATGGTLEAPWIGAGDYTFTLYAGTEHRVALASTVVTQADPR